MAANPGLAAPHHVPPQQQQQPQHFHAPNSAPARHAQLVTGARAAVPQLELKPNFYNPYHVKHRRRTTKEQLALLEGTFTATPKPSSEVRKSLAGKLQMTAREVQIWFQNRRAKQKNMMLRASSSGARSTADANTPPTSTTAATALQSEASSTSLISALLPASKNSRATSADRSAGAPSAPMSSSPPMMPTPAMRRHSDIPASFVHNEQRVAAAAANPLQMPLVSPIDKQAQLLAAPIAGTLPAGVTALAATAPCASTSPSTTLPNLSFVAAAPSTSTSRLTQSKKQKRGNNGDNDRYHTARVHQEAFDGTNKLPVKPDDPMPGADDHFLDPSNLPNFMMPGAPSSSAYAGGFGSLGLNIGSMGLSQQQQQQPPPLFGGSDVWSIPYGTLPQQQQQQQPQMQASAALSAQPQAGLGALCNSLMGISANPYSGLALNTFGLTSCGDMGSAGASAALSPTDLPFGSDATSSFYQTLFMLTQQGVASAPPLDRPPSLPSPGEAAPLSPANASTQPLPRAHGAMYMPAAALPPHMPPPLPQNMSDVSGIGAELFAPAGAQAAASTTTTM
ncbi:hypothetical protein H4R20_003760 [Coemansia guatemalensis]|uniref:Homeobox domain-containing protein n=1 Tax=Coemansia guatemalensis TaxID=2761395 RepID=A0A9W8HYX5_9FUNG|nr:hypothetical protein H4R20_003760 [Coemansia guatemalensis]